MKQNVDYQLIPGEDDWWNVRFLQGPFTETVVRMGNLVINEENDEMNFDFTLISSPDEFLSESDPEFQVAVGDVLGSLMDDAVKIMEEEKQKSK